MDYLDRLDPQYDARSPCKHDEHEDCMFCESCGNGCREDLDPDGMCPECAGPNMRRIHRSFVDGQIRQAVEWIEEVGAKEFFWSYREYLNLYHPELNDRMIRDTFDYYETAVKQYVYAKEKGTI